MVRPLAAAIHVEVPQGFVFAVTSNLEHVVLLMQAQSDVTREDQEKINTFSRLNTKLHELQALLTSKKVRWLVC